MHSLIAEQFVQDRWREACMEARAARVARALRAGRRAGRAKQVAIVASERAALAAAELRFGAR